MLNDVYLYKIWKAFKQIILVDEHAEFAEYVKREVICVDFHSIGKGKSCRFADYVKREIDCVAYFIN